MNIVCRQNLRIGVEVETLAKWCRRRLSSIVLLMVSLLLSML